MSLTAHQEAVLDIFPGPARQSSWWHERRDLQTILLKFKDCQASKPQDKIYALLNLCSSPLDSLDLLVDYEQPIEQVIRWTAKYLLVAFRPYGDLCLRREQHIPRFVDQSALLGSSRSLTILQVFALVHAISQLAYRLHPKGICRDHKPFSNTLRNVLRGEYKSCYCLVVVNLDGNQELRARITFSY